MKRAFSKFLLITFVFAIVLDNNFAQKTNHIYTDIDDQINFSEYPFNILPNHKIEKIIREKEILFDPLKQNLLQGTVWNVYDDIPIPSAASVYLDGNVISLDLNQSFEITLSGGTHIVKVIDPTRELWGYNQEFFLNSDTIYTFKILPKTVDIEVIDWASEHYYVNGNQINNKNYRYEFPVDLYLDTAAYFPYPGILQPTTLDIERMRQSFSYWEESTGIDLFNEVDTIDFNDSTLYYIYVIWKEGGSASAGTILDNEGYPRASYMLMPSRPWPPQFYGDITELHEIGHTLGFLHPKEGYNYIMSYQWCDLAETILSPKEIQSIRAKALIDRGISLYTYGYKQYFSSIPVWPPVWYGEGSGIKLNLEEVQYDPTKIIEPYQDGYLLNGTLSINANDTLVIDEGTKIYFEPNARLRIHGALIVNGTLTNKVIFTNAQQYKGTGIFFRMNEWGKQDDIQIQNAEILNFEIGLAFNGYHPNSFRALILKSVKLTGHRFGIWASRDAQNGFIRLMNCELSDNFYNTLIENINNFNSVASSFMNSNMGLYVDNPDTFSLSYNTIINNVKGLNFDKYEYPGIHTLNVDRINNFLKDDNPLLFVKNFNAYNNYDNTEFNIRTDNTDLIIAENNWWGSVDPVQIEAKMEGNIDYIPFLNQPFILNPPYIITELPDTSIFEDNLYEIDNLYSIFQDSVSSLPLTFYALSENDSIVAEIIDSIKLGVTPNPDYFGGSNIIVVAENIFGLSRVDSFYINILAVNDPPIVLDIPPIDFLEDSSYSFDLDQYVIDVDNDTTEISWSVGFPESFLNKRQLIDKEIVKKQDIFSPVMKTEGRSQELRIFQEQNANKETFFNVANTKHHKRIKTILSSMNSDSIFIDIDSSTHIVTISAFQNFNGIQIPVIFTATDDSLASDSDTTTITVVPVNDPPSAFHLILPENQDTVQSLIDPIEFLWSSSSDIDSDSLLYDLIIYTAYFDTVVGNINDTSFAFMPGTTLIENTAYYWLVNVTDLFTTVSSIDTFMFFTPIISDINDLALIPANYELMQNYPNPFNPTSTITYGLPLRSNVQLIIYNILGEKIAELVNEVQDAGYYEFRWNANSMASGIYIYSLFADAKDKSKNFRSIKKMILLK